MGARPLIWITRTEPGARRTARALRSAGWPALNAPLLRIEARSGSDLTPPVRPGGLVFTSPNAVAAVIRQSARLNWFADRADLTCFCVGDATARAARRAGFGEVFNARGDAHALLAWILDHPGRVRSPLLHPVNFDEGGRLAARLTAEGCPAVHWPLYQTVARLDPPRRLLARIDAADPVVALIHSPKAARVLAELDWRGTPLSDRLLGVIGISQAAMAPLGSATVLKCVAKTPDEPSLLLELAQFH